MNRICFIAAFCRLIFLHHSDPIRFTSPLFLDGEGSLQNYDRVGFETNVNIFEPNCDFLVSGNGCVVPPPGVPFYPFSPVSAGQEGGGVCQWQKGGNEGADWRCADAKWEARCLVQLLGRNGHTIDKLRELIRVTPKDEAILRTSALHSPILAEHIERVLCYRVQIAQEFERLIRALPKIPAE